MFLGPSINFGASLKMSFEDANKTLERIKRLIAEMKVDLKRMQEKEQHRKILESFFKVLKRKQVDYII
jgi:hypothetical protein